jgi:hypothetical protein
LFITPADTPTTFTEIVHEALEARVPPERLTWPEPVTAVAVPPQVLLRPLGEETARPAGRLSVNATPLSATFVFGFVMLKVREVTPPSEIAAEPNDLVIVGGEATARFAEDVLPVPPFVEVTAPEVFV